MDTKKQFEKILSPVIKSILHFLKIHRKVIFGNPSVIVQDMLGKAPESLNAVDMVLRSSINKRLTMIDRMMLTQSLQRVVAPEGVRVVDRTLSGLLPYDRHQLLLRYMLHDPRIDLSIAFQEAKYDVFALSPSPSLSLASATEVGLIHLHFSLQFAAFKLRYMVDRLSKLLIQAGNRLVINAEVMGKTIGGLLLVEPLNDGNLGSDLPQRLLFSTALLSASHIASRSLRYLKRTAEYTLSPLQKVGRTTENVLSTICHAMILPPHGYETH